jgi:L-rhamnose mutarotase
MERIAFIMKLKPGCVVEYRRRHVDVWPEITELLKNHGVSNYSIFLDEESNVLFAVQDIEDGDSQELGSYPIMQQWWAYMEDIMETNPDQSTVSKKLTKVFHMN